VSKSVRLKRKEDIRQKREVRVARYLKGGCGSMIFMILVLPVLVVGLNYWLGWKVAVIGFPILTYLSRNVFPFSNKSAKNTLQRLTSYPLKFAIFVVPVISVLSSEQEIMRSWALIIGISCFVFFVSDSHMFQNVFGFINFKNGSDKRIWITVLFFNALIFVMISELLWHYTSFAVWVWYHAFLYLNIMLPYILFILVAQMILGERENKQLTSTVVEKRNPPLEGSEGERYDVFIRKPNRVFHKYKNITFHQAQTILAKVKWNKELAVYEHEQIEVSDQTKPAFIIEFGGGYDFRIEPINQDYTTLYGASPKKFKFLEPWGMPNQCVAVGVPLTMVPELMRLGWIEEWEVVKNKLQPYLKAEQDDL